MGAHTKTIPTPEQVFAWLRARMPSQIRWTFAAAMILGLVVHLYMFTNKLPNHDDIHHLFDCDYGTQSGRWLLPYVLKWAGDFSLPWLNGFLGLLCLAGTACITVSLFRIRRPLACILTAGLLVSFPTVVSTYTYMFTADAYFFGLFLAAFSAYLTSRRPIMGLPLGALALIASMGIYQSYFPVAAVLMVGGLLVDTLDGAESYLHLIFRGVKMVAALALGMLVYIAVAHWATAALGGLSDYMGISSMGQIALSDLPDLIRKCYETYADYFTENDLGWYFSYLPVLMRAAAAATLALFALLVVRRRVGALRGLLAVVLLVLYPLAGNLIHIMVGGAEIHYLMIYGAVYVLVLPVALADRAGEALEGLGRVRGALASLLSWLLIVTMALMTFSYTVADNQAYLKMDLALDQLNAYSNRLISAIEGTAGYTPEVPVLLVGTSGHEAQIANLTPALNDLQMTGVFSMQTYRAQYSYGEYLNDFLAFPNTVYVDMSESEAAQMVAHSEQVAAMSAYPTAGSIQFVDGYLVVKLNDVSAE